MAAVLLAAIGQAQLRGGADDVTAPVVELGIPHNFGMVLDYPTRTPTPSPTPQPTATAVVVLAAPATIYERGDLYNAIEYWCAAYAVSCGEMHYLARCESTYGEDPRAFDGSSGHYTAFQFALGTWAQTPPGVRGVLASEATHWDAAEAAAWMLAQGRRGEWEC